MARPVVPWSPYDDAVPHVTGLPAARDRLASLRRLRAPDRVTGDELVGSVRHVVVLASSSRGGSTAVGELLRRVPGLVHLRAEINPLFALAGLHERGRTAVLLDELALDVGTPAPGLAADDVEAFALDVAWRLTAQWPAEAIDPSAVTTWVADALDAQRAAGAWRPGGPFDHDALHLDVLARARAAHPSIDPWYYDLPARTVTDRFPDVPVPSGPPGQALIEMPPYVLLGPWRPAGTATLRASTLVLSTPRNAFRLDFLASLFPHADVRVLHLTRNPAAAVNGLVDGWLHRGFFNCRVERPLAIAGYSDRFPWGRDWWCYDVPPGWEEVVDAPLPHVCSLQWQAPHEAVLDHVAGTGRDHHRVHVEDVLGGGPRRRPALAGLAAWLGVPVGAVDTASFDLPTLMATAPPAPRRWRSRWPELAPVLADPAVLDLARRLGYSAEPADWG